MSRDSGESRIRTYEGIRQQIYSLPQLAALVSPRQGFRHNDKNIINSKEQTILSDFTLQKWFANLNYFFFLKPIQLTFFKIIC